MINLELYVNQINVVNKVIGEEAVELVNQFQKGGSYKVIFNARHSGEVRNLTSGMYVYQLSSGNYIESKKMLILK